MMPHAELWLFVSALSVLAVIARERSGAVAFARPLVAILSAGALSMIVIGEERGSPETFGVVLTLACAIVCAASDLATGLIFDGVTALTALVILATASIGGNAGASITGACVCGGSMFALYAITSGRGIGLGDVKLGAVIGAGCGGVAAISSIGVAFVAGSIWASALLLSNRARWGDRVPFAPFLTLGTLVSLGMNSLDRHG